MTNARILIVDDDQALLESLPETLRLRMDDLEVDTSDSAREALQRIAEAEHDALVVDIKMPGMDGLELLAEIKKVRPDTPTILITGHGDHELAVAALRLGAYDYVTKPIDRDYFVSCLTRAMVCHRLARDVATRRLELLRHTEELEACVQERTVELREALHREQIARRELDEAHRRLEELSHQRDMFVSMVAHDLATPLTSIRGYADMLGRGRLNPERQERARALIASETDRLARLARDLAGAAQVISGQFHVRATACDLAEMAREQVDLIRTRTTRHTIVLDAPPSLPIECDRDRVVQVLSNLLTNAVKYAPDGEIGVQLHCDEEQAYLTVSDQGPGIPPELAESVFEPGRRLAQPAGDASSEGTGFGLHIVRSIVEAHGGRIWVAPSSGPGATLCVSLPLTSPSSSVSSGQATGVSS
jgi:two-component system, sensor histidine kinase and response regulator